MANVLHLFRAAQRRLPMEEITEVRALPDSGLEGCAHARKRSPQQVLLMDSETLEAMDLPPGIIRENVTTSGINVNGLAAAARRGGAAGSEHGLHALRFAGKNQAGAATRVARPPGHAVPSDRRWDDSARRQRRKDFLAIRRSGLSA